MGAAKEVDDFNLFFLEDEKRGIDDSLGDFCQ